MNASAFDFDKSCTTDGFILGLSFSVDIGSIALRTAQGNTLTASLEGHRSHSSDSLYEVHQLMESAGLSPSDCVAVAADVGPGGFTGLRTACGLAQGLAVGWNVPCITRTSLELLAFSQARSQQAASGNANGCYLAALDARQNEVYAALHELRANHWHCLQAPRLLPYGASLKEMLADFTSKDAHVASPVSLRAVCGNGALNLLRDIEPGYFLPDAVPQARALVELAAFDLLRGACVFPAECQPLYVREQMALTTEQRKARLHV